jgi:hypothetical protein
MQFSRRQFVNSLSAVAGASVLSSGLALVGLKEAKAASLNSLESSPQHKLRKSHFEHLVNHRFHLQDVQGQVSHVHLVSLVEEKRKGRGSVNLEQFTLKFQAAQGQTLEQAVYQFEHPQLGRFHLGILPVADQGKTCYLAHVCNFA